MKEALLVEVMKTINPEIEDHLGVTLDPHDWIDYLEIQLKEIKPHNPGPFVNPIDAAFNFVGSESLAQKITDNEPIQGVGITDWFEVVCLMKLALAKNASSIQS